MAVTTTMLSPSEEEFVLSQTEEALVQEYNAQLRNTVLPVTVLFGVEIVFGIIGNLLTLYVFSFHYKPCNFRYFVLCLALTDLISCLTTIPGEMVSQIYWYAYPVPPVCKIKAFFNQFTVCSEAACLTVIAIDRYRKICQPFGWQIKQNIAIYVCIGIYVAATLLAIPTPIFWGVHNQKIVYRNRNITVTVCEKDEKYVDTKFPLVNIAFNQTLVFLSLICMFVLYILVGRRLINGQKEIKRRSMERKPGGPDNTMSEIVSSASTADMSVCKVSSKPGSDIVSESEQTYESNEKSEKGQTRKGQDKLDMMVKARRKTRIMFYLTVIFIVTTVMYGALLSIVAHGILPTLSGPQKVAFFFFLRLYFINHVINPVLYGLMDPQFRLQMRRLRLRIFKCCCFCSKFPKK